MKLLTLVVLLTPLVRSAPKSLSRDPICIVGAGVSGLTAAKTLEDRGHRTILFDKRPTVGGKCQSYYEYGNYFPLGAVFFTDGPSYAETFKVVNLTGVNYTIQADHERWTFDSKSGLSAQTPPRSPEIDRAMMVELSRYTEFWETSFAAVGSIGYKNGVPAEFAVPAREWLLRNGYPLLASVINYGTGIYGYGNYAEVPVLYIFRFFSPDILESWLEIREVYKTDFFQVFTRISKTIGGPIHLGSEIERINRGSTPTIHYARAAEQITRIQKCSDIILAFPPTIPALDNAGIRLSPAEAALFGSVTTENYFVAAVRMVGFPYGTSFTIELPDPVTPFDAEGQPVYLTALHPDSNVISAWSVDKPGAEGSESTVGKMLPETLSKLNKDHHDLRQASRPVRQSDVLASSGSVDYFPHVGPEELVDGWYDEFNLLQGNQHTYFTSGLNSFELVEFAIRAAQDLVVTHF